MRNKCKEIWDSIRLLWEFDKAIIFISILMAMVDAVLPYGGILLSAHILDELAAGEGLFDLLPVTSSFPRCVHGWRKNRSSMWNFAVPRSTPKRPSVP